MGLCQTDFGYGLAVPLVTLLEICRHKVVEVGEEVVVKDELRTLPLVILGLVGSKFLAHVHDPRVNAVAIALLQVLHHVSEDILVGGDCAHHVMVADHPERTHQVNELQVPCNRGEGDLEQVLPVPLHDYERPVPAILREDLRHVNTLVVALRVLGHDLVGREILKGHQDALGPVHNEIPARVQRIFPMGDPLVLAHAVEVACRRPHHDGQLPDRGDDRVLAFAPLHKGQFQVNWCGIREVAKPRLAWEEIPLGAVRLPHQRLFHLYFAEFHPYRVIAPSPNLDVGLDDPLFIDYLLQVLQKKIVKRVELVARHMLLGEICLR
ncbi:MAG: hypothetical protein A4E40_00241 [Methanoregulaceae archaeon PtaU1.Bin059]|nr:MAG: hypothetical protein A4E40_00241 [Methanoregulaceae archaeon PtaU1.Bin059]